MANSNYYYNEMIKCGKQKRNDEEKKIEYLKYIEKIKKLKENIPDVSQKLIDAKNYFFQGGYKDSGETLDRGKLEIIKEDLDNSVDRIDKIINKLNVVIDNLSTNIAKYTKLYNEAHSNYERELRKEKES